MRASAALAVIALVALLMQWSGLANGLPYVSGVGLLLAIGLFALLTSVLIGLIRGTWLYRLACLFALASFVALVISTFGFSRGEDLRRNVFFVGLGLAALAVGTGALTLRRLRHVAAASPGAPSTPSG